MKFGVFIPNGSNGYIPSRNSPQYLPSFAHNKAVTLEAERQGLDFVLSMMKHQGFGGATGYWDACLESFTLMASLAAVTSRIELFPSVTLLATHPAVAARMVATIDDISGGRCGLNIVTGWNSPEYLSMGLWPGDDYFGRRYAYAAEYLDILRGLWRDGRISHRGEYFQLDDCTVYPQPRRPIPIVCAGQSEQGLRFTAERGEHSFVIGEAAVLKTIAGQLDAHARANSRTVTAFGLFQLIIAPTDAEARTIAEHVVAGADVGALENVTAAALQDSVKGGTSDRMRTGLARDLDIGNAAFMGIPVIHGCAETVARKIDDIAAETGAAGMLFSCLDFVATIREFGEAVLPRLRCAQAA